MDGYTGDPINLLLAPSIFLIHSLYIDYDSANQSKFNFFTVLTSLIVPGILQEGI